MIKLKVFLFLFAAAATMGFAHSVSAKTIDLLDKCDKFSSRSQAEGCCNTYLRKHGKARWMRQVEASCKKAVERCDESSYWCVYEVVWYPPCVEGEVCYGPGPVVGEPLVDNQGKNNGHGNGGGQQQPNG